MNTSSNIVMNMFSIDTLTGNSQPKDIGNYTISSRMSSSPFVNTGGTKLIDTNLVTNVATARRVSLPVIMTCVPNNNTIPKCRASNDNTSCLSINGSQAHQPAAVSAAEHASMVQSKFDSTVTAPSRRRKPNFAEKLHLILNSNDCRHAVAWLPSGRSFCITDQDEFVKKILPKFFREAKFESFSRRLKRWGFRKVYTTGMSQIIFSHDLFHRDRPDLCKVMNGREKVVQGQENKRAIIGRTSTTSPLSTQQQLRNAVMVRQTQQQHLLRQVSFQQQIGQQSTLLATTQPRGHSPSRVGSLQNAISSVQSLMALQGSSPEKIDAQAMINMANALVAKPIPQASNSQLNSEECGTIYQANIQLNRLNDDIANCEEQLAILQRLKGLKETHRQLAGACSPRGISPSSV